MFVKFDNNKIILKHKIINCLTINGNKRTAEKIFLKTLKLLQQSSVKNSKDILKFAIINLSPILFIRQKKRKKRVLTEIPFLLKPSLRISYAIKDVVKSIRKNKKNFFYVSFKYELINTLMKNSDSLKHKEEIHQRSFVKKAFSHFRWF